MALTMSRVDASRPPGVSMRMITTSALRAAAFSSEPVTKSAVAGPIGPTTSSTMASCPAVSEAISAGGVVVDFPGRCRVRARRLPSGNKSKSSEVHLNHEITRPSSTTPSSAKGVAKEHVLLLIKAGQVRKYYRYTNFAVKRGAFDDVDQ